MKVLWLLDELAIPFDRIDAGGAFGRTRDPDYAAMNPNATVPTLVMPHGYTLWESHSILRYLCRTQPGGNALYPEAPEARQCEEGRSGECRRFRRSLVRHVQGRDR